MRNIQWRLFLRYIPRLAGPKVYLLIVPQVADFGLAGGAPLQQVVRRAPNLRGTPHSLLPEQIPVFNSTRMRSFLHRRPWQVVSLGICGELQTLSYLGARRMG